MEPFKFKYVNEDILARVIKEVEQKRAEWKDEEDKLEPCRYLLDEMSKRQNEEKDDVEATFELCGSDNEETLRIKIRSRVKSKIAKILERQENVSCAKIDTPVKDSRSVAVGTDDDIIAVYSKESSHQPSPQLNRNSVTKLEPSRTNKAETEPTVNNQYESVSEVEVADFEKKLKQYRANIKLLLDKIRLKIDDSPNFDEEKHWHQMRIRVKEFESRFSRNHIYQLKRLFEEFDGPPLQNQNSYHQTHLQMKRILLLHQKLHQAIQAFFRSMDVIWMGRHNQTWLATLKDQRDGAKVTLLSLLNMVSGVNGICDPSNNPDLLEPILVKCIEDGLVVKSEKLTLCIIKTAKAPRVIKNPAAQEIKNKLKSAYKSSSLAKFKQPASLNVINELYGDSKHPPVNITSVPKVTHSLDTNIHVIHDGRRQASFNNHRCHNVISRTNTVSRTPSRLSTAKTNDDSKTPNTKKAIKPHCSASMDNMKNTKFGGKINENVKNMSLAAILNDKLPELCQQLLPMIAKAFTQRKTENARAHTSNVRDRLPENETMRLFIEDGGRAEGWESTISPAAPHEKQTPERLSIVVEDQNIEKYPERRPRKLTIDEKILNDILVARKERIEELVMSDYYKINGHSRPWQIIESVADTILGELLTDVNEEIVAVQESVVRGLFDAEFS